MVEYRKESDLLGEMNVPKSVLFGIQTYRAVLNFPVNDEKKIGDYPSIITALVNLKKAAAIVNGKHNFIPQTIAKSIAQAADEIIQKGLFSEFPIHALHGGGGTSANMNVNEVLANMAEEILGGVRGEYKIVHPNDHVNFNQSTNDIYPSACHIAIILSWKMLKDKFKKLATEFETRGEELQKIKHLARTCLQDAIDISYKDFLSGYSAMIRRSVKRIDNAIRNLYAINIGGTIVGRTSDADPGYLDNILPAVREVFEDDNYHNSLNYFDAAQNPDDLANVSNQIALLAQGLVKIAQDFRILGSGPESGINELILPPVQPGSSIMPGKVNPVIPEFLIQLCYKVIGNNYSCQLAVTTGELDLNIWESLMAFSVIDSLELLVTGVQTFNEKCVRSFQVNIGVNDRHVNSIIPLLTKLMHKHGYTQISAICKESHGNMDKLRELLRKNGYIT